MYPRKVLVIFLSLIVINCLIDEIDGKRGIAIARRAKGSGKSYNSRRGRGQDHHTDIGHVERAERHAIPPAPASAAAIAPASKVDTSVKSPANTQPIGWNVNNNKPVGPPPAYPGLGGSGSNINGPPPSYGQAVGAPPSYPGTYGSYGYGYPQTGSSNIQKIPQRGQPGVASPIDTTSFHGLGPGHNGYGGPSHTGGLYNNQFQSAPGTLYSNHNQPAPQNAWGAQGGGYGQGYGYEHKSSNPLSFGNVLTGLALWNVARGFNSYPSHQQHIHYHDSQPTQMPVNGITQATSVNLNADGLAQHQQHNISTVRPPAQPTVPVTVPPIAGK